MITQKFAVTLSDFSIHGVLVEVFMLFGGFLDIPSVARVLGAFLAVHVIGNILGLLI